MNTKNKIIAFLTFMVAFFASCNDFEKINENPNDVSEDKVLPQWFLNGSIIEAQMNPEIAERVFVLEWNRSSRFNRGSGFTIGTDNNDWNTLYLGNGYAVKWLNLATKAIQSGEYKVAQGDDVLYPYFRNVIQMARIWRAFLNAQVADCFGPIPALDAFTGVPGTYDSQEAIYTYVLQELREAQAALDVSIDMSAMANEDAFFAGDVSKWIKYANSMRMRYAMRIINELPELAKTEFEDAASLSFISTAADMAGVQERGGWDALTGVMSRTWNAQPMSATFKNLVVGLGDEESFKNTYPDMPAEVAARIKNPRTYLGQYLYLHFPLNTNDPCAGFYFDGIPQYVDPRAPELFSIVGWDDGTIYPDNIGAASGVSSAVPLLNPNNTAETMITVDAVYTWDTWVAGLWDKLDGISSALVSTSNIYYPCMAKKYRQSDMKRVFFASWESYFLLAEAGVLGWTVPGTTQSNYEAGIAASFEYQGVSNLLSGYLTSTSYNRVGTSVSFTHTTEATPYSISYYDPYDKTTKSMTYTYPTNSIYKNGAYNNDQMTKIMTQKFIAQVPWLPDEAWSDHRRIGLPFFENQAVEIDYNPLNQVPLTVAQAKDCKLEFYPKRFRYPANIQTNNQEGYADALKLLGGPDLTTTSLWWNKTTTN